NASSAAVGIRLNAVVSSVHGTKGMVFRSLRADEGAQIPPCRTPGGQDIERCTRQGAFCNCLEREATLLFPGIASNHVARHAIAWLSVDRIGKNTRAQPSLRAVFLQSRDDSIGVLMRGLAGFLTPEYVDIPLSPSRAGSGGRGLGRSGGLCRGFFLLETLLRR